MGVPRRPAGKRRTRVSRVTSFTPSKTRSWSRTFGPAAGMTTGEGAGGAAVAGWAEIGREEPDARPARHLVHPVEDPQLEPDVRPPSRDDDGRGGRRRRRRRLG